MVYTANWGIICHLPPFRGTRNNYLQRNPFQNKKHLHPRQKPALRLQRKMGWKWTSPFRALRKFIFLNYPGKTWICMFDAWKSSKNIIPKTWEFDGGFTMIKSATTSPEKTHPPQNQGVSQDFLPEPLEPFRIFFMATLTENPGLKVKLLVGPTCKIPRSTQRGCSGIRRSPKMCQVLMVYKIFPT